MDRKTEQAYKRKCFQGRGVLARWLDRAFFSGLSGVCLYIWKGSALFSCLLAGAVLLLLLVWEGRRWGRFRQKLWRDAAMELKREAWMEQEAARIRREGGVILFPTPEEDALTGACLCYDPGARFHCFGEPRENLIEKTRTMGCVLVFHPWQEGPEPDREQVIERLRRDAPRRDHRLWRSLLRLPGNRYLLTGMALILLSMVLRRALYWRLLGSLCLLIGAIRRALRLPLQP